MAFSAADNARMADDDRAVCRLSQRDDESGRGRKARF